MGRLTKVKYLTENAAFYLRELNIQDASLMLEWMHTADVVCYLNKNFSLATLLDCRKFIEKSLTDETNVHMAIVDNFDTYLGTVSLKNIDENNGEAEFAIVLRKCAMGKGISQVAMKLMLHIGMDELNLKRIYWCVSVDNLRAIHFYDKNGYTQVDNNGSKQYLWYEVKKSDD